MDLKLTLTETQFTLFILERWVDWLHLTTFQPQPLPPLFPSLPPTLPPFSPLPLSNRLSCSPNWLRTQTCYIVVKCNLDFRSVYPAPWKDYRHASQGLIYAILEIEHRASCMLGKWSVKEIISLPRQGLFLYP